MYDSLSCCTFIFYGYCLEMLNIASLFFVHIINIQLLCIKFFVIFTPEYYLQNSNKIYN